MNPVDFGVTGSKVKVTSIKCFKTISELILNCLIQLYKILVTKKALGGIMFYKHLVSDIFTVYANVYLSHHLI